MASTTPKEQVNSEVETHAEITSIFDSPKVRMALQICALLVIVYVLTSIKSFADSPVGAALSKLLGTAGAVLTWFAGLPTWLIIGGLLTWLLGPAITHLAGTDTVKNMAEKVKAAYESMKERIAEYMEDSSKGLEPDAEGTKAVGELVVSKIYGEALTESKSAGGVDSNANAAIEAAQSMNAKAAAVIGELPADELKRVSEAADKVQEDVDRVDNAHPAE